MKIKKLKEFDKKRIMIFIGSSRSKDNCPDQESKTNKIVKKAIKNLPDNIEIDLVDLSIKDKNPIIQPCKGCVSTAGGAHCHYKCDCYFKKDKDSPDFISDFDIYDRLEKCDAFIIFSPIYWWSVTTQVKALFDRLVCASLTITEEQARELLGDDIKNASKTKKLSETEKYKKLVKNHLEGKVAAFYIHGDNGADDYSNIKIPDSFKKHKIGNFNDPKNTILPIVWQCRYMGIDVPDDFIDAFYINENISYSKANDKMDDDKLKFAVKKAKDLILKVNEYLK